MSVVLILVKENNGDFGSVIDIRAKLCEKKWYELNSPIMRNYGWIKDYFDLSSKNYTY